MDISGEKKANKCQHCKVSQLEPHGSELIPQAAIKESSKAKTFLFSNLQTLVIMFYFDILKRLQPGGTALHSRYLFQIPTGYTGLINVSSPAALEVMGSLKRISA